MEPRVSERRVTERRVTERRVTECRSTATDIVHARRAAEVITRDDNRGGIDLLNDKEKTLRKRVAI